MSIISLELWNSCVLQLQALQTSLFLSVQLDGQGVSESRFNRVATRPWLAFQAKPMVKMHILNIKCLYFTVSFGSLLWCKMFVFYHGALWCMSNPEHPPNWLQLEYWMFISTSVIFKTNLFSYESLTKWQTLVVHKYSNCLIQSLDRKVWNNKHVIDSKHLFICYFS